MLDGVERRMPKLPRNAPIDSGRKRTSIEPLGNIAIESAPFAPSASRRLAKSGDLGDTERCLLVAPIVLTFMNPRWKFDRDVWARQMPNSTDPSVLLIKNVAARLRIPIDYALKEIRKWDFPLLRHKLAGEITRMFPDG